MLLRVSFGVSLAMIGVIHYQTLDGYITMVSGGLGSLAILGTVWAYAAPAAMILGGLLLAVGRYSLYGAWIAGVPLALIPVGLLLGPLVTGAELTPAMGMVNAHLVWLLVFFFVAKSGSCCGNCAAPSAVGMGMKKK